MFKAPKQTAPAARNRCTITASASAAASASLILAPASVGDAGQIEQVLDRKGTPASGPGSPPAATVASIASASARAGAAVSVVNVPSARGRAARFGPDAPWRSPAAVVARERMAAAMLAAVA